VTVSAFFKIEITTLTSFAGAYVSLPACAAVIVQFELPALVPLIANGLAVTISQSPETVKVTAKLLVEVAVGVKFSL
jgi:hypothetical protein